MAPEILEGCVNFGMEDCLKIDIYAFALVLWEMASRTDTHGDGSCKCSLGPSVGLHNILIPNNPCAV